jgi:hypothetical protein
MAGSIDITGSVTELDISGFGPNSAQLEFAFAPATGGPASTFVMQTDAVPQMFAAATTMLTMAYQFKTIVVITVPQPPTQPTPRISGVKMLPRPLS